MLEGGTKVIVTADLFTPVLCKEGSLRLAKAVHKEKSTEVKTADSENGEPKKPKKKSSKSRKQSEFHARLHKQIITLQKFHIHIFIDNLIKTHPFVCIILGKP